MGLYVISMTCGVGHISANLVLKPVRAKYIIMPNGDRRLAAIMEFSRPVFNPGGYVPEDGSKSLPEDLVGEAVTPNECSGLDNIRRALRRAKGNAFDLVACNPDLDWFVTLTYDPSRVRSRSDYDEVYHKLKIFLGNRVARYGLKYVCVPEHHKDGENIHWHMICNGRGLDLIPSGIRSRSGDVWNVRAWQWGFSTALHIGDGVADRDRVAKYVYKYMGKQVGQMIGGRYFLHGGKLARPVFEYFDSPEECCPNLGTAAYHKEKEVVPGIVCREWSFI